MMGLIASVHEILRGEGRKTRCCWVGASTKQCLNSGLVDEIVIHLAPVLIGEGIRLFYKLKEGDIEQKRNECIATGGITSLRFRVIKERVVAAVEECGYSTAVKMNKLSNI